MFRPAAAVNPETTMSQSKGDQAFVDAIPEVYDRLLVPLIFESYAADLARRARSAA